MKGEFCSSNYYFFLSLDKMNKNVIILYKQSLQRQMSPQDMEQFVLKTSPSNWN